MITKSNMSSQLKQHTGFLLRRYTAPRNFPRHYNYLGSQLNTLKFKKKNRITLI